MAKIDSRGKVESDTQKRDTEFGEQEKRAEQTREDKEVVAELGKALKQGGTTEGRRAVKESAEKAGESVHQFMEKEKGKADQLSEKGKQAEGVLREGEKAAAEDSADAKKSTGRIKLAAEAKKGLESVAAAAKEDSDFLKKSGDAEKKIRERLEKKAKEELERERGIKVQVKG